MARDQVRVDRQVQHAQPVVEVVLPHGRVPLEEQLAAPDVVDQHVQPALLGVDALHERLDLRGLEVIDLDRDPGASGRVDELGGLLDRLRPVVLGASLPRRAAGAVHGRARLAERHRDAAAGAPGGAGHERHLVGERGGVRHRTLQSVMPPIMPCRPRRGRELQRGRERSLRVAVIGG